MTEFDLKERIGYIQNLWHELFRKFEMETFTPNPTIPVLYHYTDLVGLNGILENNCVWASNINFINDSTEYIYGVEIFKEAVELVKKNIKNEYLYEILKEISGKKDIIKDNVFCISFCENNDLLSQWRGYSNSGGVAIGFENSFLSYARSFIENKCTMSMSSKPCKVFYGNSKGIQVFGELIMLIDNFITENAEIETMRKNKVIDYILLSAVSELAPLFKNEAFQEENEWRIVVCLDEANVLFPYIDFIKFRPRGDILLPYICLFASNLRTENDANQSKEGESRISKPQYNEHTMLPIKEIIIGPSSNKEITKTSIEYYLNSKEIDNILVKASSIPFRN